MIASCPSCSQQLIPPRGPKDAPILILGEFPGPREIEMLRPFVGGAGRVLREELGLVGIDMRQCRISNLWLHAKNGNSACYSEGLRRSLKEAKGRKAVLLLGSDCAKAFVRRGVMEICGLRIEDDIDLFKAPIVYAAPNPASLFHSAIGEFRLCMERFSNDVEDFI